MNIISVDDAKYCVIRDLVCDLDHARKIKSVWGGTLIRKSDSEFKLCQLIADAEFEDINRNGRANENQEKLTA